MIGEEFKEQRLKSDRPGMTLDGHRQPLSKCLLLVTGCVGGLLCILKQRAMFCVLSHGSAECYGGQGTFLM